MKHRFNIWYDLLLPMFNRIVGKEHGCCDKIRNCKKCLAKKAREDE